MNEANPNERYKLLKQYRLDFPKGLHIDDASKDIKQIEAERKRIEEKRKLEIEAERKRIEEKRKLEIEAERKRIEEEDEKNRKLEEKLSQVLGRTVDIKGVSGNYVLFENSILYDQQNGLEWCFNLKRRNFTEIKSWISKLEHCGYGWQLPKQTLLEQLLDDIEIINLGSGFKKIQEEESIWSERNSSEVLYITGSSDLYSDIYSDLGIIDIGGQLSRMNKSRYVTPYNLSKFHKKHGSLERFQAMLDSGEYDTSDTASAFAVRKGLYIDDASKAIAQIEERKRIEAAKERKRLILTRSRDGIDMEFVWVPKGCYHTESDSGDENELTIQQVCVDGFWIGKYEVTQSQYESVVRSNPSYFKDCGGSCPVDSVGRLRAGMFLDVLNSKMGKEFRLPSKKEWEYAAKSAGKNEKYSGGNSISNFAWYKKNSGGKTHRVGTKSPNGLGIYDMSGNVCEWSNDPDKFEDNAPGNYLHGGSWELDSWMCLTTSYLRSFGTVSDEHDYGLRLVLVSPQKVK